ncbi:hypothetical protein LCGC14_0413530 [marine sediment metagenome]|uniref:Uncharacterized protein n=1 Tax=marine sediment metagenome TaxID=412755 RepID=A0A0F9VEY3_9ZZZZ
MAAGRIGSKIGAFRRATIRGFNPNGTVRIGLDEGPSGKPSTYNVPISAAWTGKDGEFVGGYPEKGQSVVVSQGQSGEWYIVSFINSNDTFSASFVSSGSTKMSALRPGRALLQSKNGVRLFTDPNIGIQAGSARSFMHINPIRDIISHNFDSEYSFTEASRHINQPIKRDLSDNLSRNVLGSTLDSQAYDSSLFSVGMDPLTAICPRTVGSTIRNLPLVEDREIIYEFARSFRFTTDDDESAKYDDPTISSQQPKVSRRNMRSDAFSLSLEHPNHLMETIKGTGVDAFGNILDINRSPLPIGRTEPLSLRKNTSKSDAFNLIRGQHRKAIAYHFEINARKGGIDDEPVPSAPPDINKIDNYARDRSRLSVDIDKEGQFKINIPASSEIGNIPLLTRHESFSVVDAKKTGEIHPDEFVRNEDKQDILLESFAGKAIIGLSASNDDLEGFASPIDRNTGEPIKYGTAFHDITKVCISFTENSPFLDASLDGEPTRDFIEYYPEHHLNTSFTPLEKIVSDEIIISGPDADAGGRSGSINLDGFLSLNIGANTVDRQSMWIDTAGGIVANIGRDLRNVSYAGRFDGDVFMEIGGAGIGNTFDSRFAEVNDGQRLGNLQVHVLTSNGVMVFKMGTNENGSAGVDISSPGNITISCQQDMFFKAVGAIKFDANMIMFHAEDAKRVVQKIPNKSI